MMTPTRSRERRTLLLAALTPLFALLLVSRRPDIVTHAAFWAEDGWVWYPDAYTQGIASLTHPFTGYLQTLSRLVALASLAFPLAWAPTIFALTALAIEMTVALFLLSRRLDEAWPSLPGRLLFALLYLLLPNSFETFGNLTNAQWHLALLAFLVVVSQLPAKRAGRVTDIALLLLSGLSGPLTLFLLPVAAFEVWRASPLRPRMALARLAALALAAAIQLPFELPSIAHRAPLLGATPDLFARIVSQQILLGATFGRHSMALYRDWPVWQDGLLPALVLFAALAVMLAALRRGPVLFRSYAFFAFASFAATLRTPVAGMHQAAWPLLAEPDLGDRYYLLPMLAWIAALCILAFGHGRSFGKRGGTVLLALTIASLPGDWHFGTIFPIGGRTDFQARAHAFAHAPSGTVMTFPIHPDGVAPMRLVHR